MMLVADGAGGGGGASAGVSESIDREEPSTLLDGCFADLQAVANAMGVICPATPILLSRPRVTLAPDP